VTDPDKHKEYYQILIIWCEKAIDTSFLNVFAIVLVLLLVAARIKSLLVSVSKIYEVSNILDMFIRFHLCCIKQFNLHRQ
jgi:hypothetical protein